MLPMGAALRLAGYETRFFDYPSTLYPMEILAEDYLEAALDALSDRPVVHVVAHSLGGTLMRYCLQKHDLPQVGRVVMLSTAQTGSPLLRFYEIFPLARLLLGPAGAQSGADPANLFPFLSEPIPRETGIIAGCLPSGPLSCLLMPWPQDGQSTVAATRLKGMKDHIVLPATHDGIMFHPAAIFQTLHFLQHGAFMRIS
jgi:triacylglycerol lipase